MGRPRGFEEEGWEGERERVMLLREGLCLALPLVRNAMNMFQAALMTPEEKR